MRLRHLGLLVLGASLACAATPEPAPDPDPYREPGEIPDIEPKTFAEQGMVLQVYTYKAIAEQLGIAQGFAQLAGLGCSRQYRCNPDELRYGDTVFNCKIRLARTWCPPGICPDATPEPYGPEWETCYSAVVERECASIDEPIECPLLREHSLELRPTDWLLSGRLRSPGPAQR